MSTQAVQTTEKEMSYVPYAGVDKIKLTVSIVQNLIAVPTRSGKTCSPKDAIKFMMLCEAQRLNPFAGDAYLVGYDNQKSGQATFSLITAHVALLKRAEGSEYFEGMESGIILKDDNGHVTEREGDFHLPEEIVMGGWARVYRKGRKSTYRRLAITQRRPAYETPFWQGDKASEQIVKCAESDALRAAFPSLMGGLYTEGEHGRAVIDVSTVPTDLPAAGSRLVSFAPQADAAPEPHSDGGRQEENAPTGRVEPKPAIQEAKPTVQDSLAKLVLGAGFDFNQLVAWGTDTGNIPDAVSLTGFDDLPDSVCQRLLRAQKGLLAGLAMVKGGGK
jgi:phage recombination protein Bet